METIKSYTDIEQSKKLAEILPLESADYCWGIDDETLHYNNSPYPCTWKDYTCKEFYIPCWSLASLLDVLPILEKKGYQKAKPRLLYDVAINKWIVDSHVYTTDAYDNPVDACMDMVLKLNELKIL